MVGSGMVRSDFALIGGGTRMSISSALFFFFFYGVRKERGTVVRKKKFIKRAKSFDSLVFPSLFLSNFLHLYNGCRY